MWFLLMCFLDLQVGWRNGEDAGLVFQGSVVRASAQEIFHSNSGLLSFKKPETVLWTIAKYYHLLLLRGRVDMVGTNQDKVLTQ